MDTSITPRAMAGLCALAFASLASAASAAPVPSYATPPKPGAETIHGTVAAAPSENVLLVRDERGFTDRVQLRGSTVLNPTGLTLEAGQPVTIVGSNGGSVFEADEIDLAEGAGPDAGGYDAVSYDDGPYPYVAPYYAYGYPYGFYPGFGVGFYFGGGYYHGWGHGYGYGYGHGGGGYHGGYPGGGYSHGVIGHSVSGGSGSRGSSGASRGGGGGRR